MPSNKETLSPWCRDRANCTCSGPGPITSSLCSPSAIVSLVPVPSFSLSLFLSLPPDLIYPFPFLAQPVSFYPLFTGCMQTSSSSPPPCLFPVFNSNVLSYACSSHWQGLATISSICETIVAIARLSLSGSPFYRCVPPISLAALHLPSVCSL